MSKEKQSSYFLRTQSSILNREKQINYNSCRDKIMDNNHNLNKKYFSVGNNQKKNRRYISKNKNQKNKEQITKNTYVGIDLQKVSGSTYFQNNKNNQIKKTENKNDKKPALNYYQYLSKKNNKEKEKEKIINNKSNKNIDKQNKYSPFHEIISNIKTKSKSNNTILRNNNCLNEINKYLLNPHSKSKEKNPKEENKQNYSFCDNINEKEDLYYINNNSNYTRTFNYLNNNYMKEKDSRYNYTFNKYNNNINNRNIYLDENIINEDINNKKTNIIKQINNIIKTNPNNINTKENNHLYNKFNKNNNSNLYKRCSLTYYNYNNIQDNNSIYTPLPYKSFLRDIFDQNNTNRFIKDFNLVSTSRKLDNQFEFDKNDENLKKMLESVPRHFKAKNKSEIFFLNENKFGFDKNRKNNIYHSNKNNKVNNKKKIFEIINNIMPPNKLIEEQKEDLINN